MIEVLVIFDKLVMNKATQCQHRLNLKPFSAERKKLQLAKDIQSYASAGQQRKMQAESVAGGYKEKTDKLHSP